MLNVKFSTWETVKVIFVNGNDITLEDVSKVEEDEAGFIHFTDIYGSDVLIANKQNVIGFQKTV